MARPWWAAAVVAAALLMLVSMDNFLGLPTLVTTLVGGGALNGQITW
jgi:hypothetical protein